MIGPREEIDGEEIQKEKETRQMSNEQKANDAKEDELMTKEEQAQMKMFRHGNFILDRAWLPRENSISIFERKQTKRQRLTETDDAQLSLNKKLELQRMSMETEAVNFDIFSENEAVVMLQVYFTTLAAILATNFNAKHRRVDTNQYQFARECENIWVRPDIDSWFQVSFRKHEIENSAIFGRTCAYVITVQYKLCIQVLRRLIHVRSGLDLMSFKSSLF